MFNFIRKRQKRASEPSGLETQETAPSLPVEGCAYVIGDIHGCYDELVDLLARIETDIKARDEAGPIYIVFLGDLMDRGPRSNDVIETLMNFKPDYATPIFIMGNHEEIFLKVLSGSSSALPSWFEFGGRSTSRSYGVENLGAVFTNPANLVYQLQKKVPKTHIDFMSSFQDSFQFGPYLCVHAGIRPKVPLENQSAKDIRWIRKDFLNSQDRHPLIIIHGHTIVEQATALHNRIAVDTGAYNGGPLTAVRLNQSGHSFIQTTPKVVQA